MESRWKTSAREREVPRYLADYCPSLHGGRDVRCCVFAFFAVPPPRNRHVRRKERTTKEVAGKPVLRAPAGPPARVEVPRGALRLRIPRPRFSPVYLALRLTVCLLSALRSEAQSLGSQIAIWVHQHVPSFLFPSFSLTRILLTRM